ncbi:MAG: hypothetical protein ACOCXA_04550 [Planctomycetota bacterium]
MGPPETILLFLEDLRGDLFACTQYEALQELIDDHRLADQRVLVIGDQDAAAITARLEGLTDEVADGADLWQELYDEAAPQDLNQQLQCACETLGGWLAEIGPDRIGVLVFTGEEATTRS